MFQSRQNQFDAASTGQSNLAEILGAFSYALDLTEGQPAGHSLRACWIGTQVAKAIGLSGAALHDVYYAVMLKDLGCSVNAARVSEMFVGDDRKLKHDFKLIGPDAADFGAFIGREVGVSASAGVRDAAIANLYANAGAIMTDIMETRCTRGADIARQLRFSENVAQAIAHLDEHWDGSGLPSGTAGEAIHIGGRIALLAQVADVFFSTGGAVLTTQEVARRSGGWLDPDLCDVFLKLAGERDFWTTLASPDLPADVLALEPALKNVTIDEDYLDDIAAAFGQVIDAKSPYTGGHSDRVGRYAEAVAQRMGFNPADRRKLRRAAMLHDVGKLGVSSAILEKPGKLDADEWAAMQSHAAHTTHILGQIGVMRDMAMIAGSHHERLDGKGYPLGLDARSISLESRVITVADFYDALTADRPYRAALPSEKALEIMESEVGTGIDAECFNALKSALAVGIADRPLPSVAAYL